jgi:hypothetical protein
LGHWTHGFRNVIRAYAFQRDGDEGVSIYRQGDVPDSVLADVADEVANVTGWPRNDPGATERE